jgi:hypothetical protein
MYGSDTVNSVGMALGPVVNHYPMYYVNSGMNYIHTL